MIVFVEGALAGAGPGYAIVNVGGIGLRVNAPASTIARLPAAGQRVKLLTSFLVREDSLTLYGFLTEAEQSLFTLLLGVSGLGPARALALLSASPVDTLRTDIAHENAAALMRIPGVGRKLAGQIILDLKSKVGVPAAAGATSTASGLPGGPDDSEILEWLLSMGFESRKAQSALAQLPSDASLSQDERAIQALAHARRA